MIRFSTVILIFIGVASHAQVLGRRTATLMGGKFEITLVAGDSVTTEHNIDLVIAEIARIENLISDWKPDSQVSQVNANAGIHPVKVDAEVFDLTVRALALSAMTNGAFDISFAAMEKLWKFDGSMTSLPSPDAIKRSVAKVGYQNIILDKSQSTIFLKLPGMKIGFGALGEGYAADRCRDMMIARGITSGIVNGTGDMITWGRQPNGKPWTVGITDPHHPAELLAIVPIKNNAVVTSGSYEKFTILEGKRYPHIINPTTGYPATGVISVTVFGPSSERANGFSTSMMVLGRDAALQFIKRFPDYHYVLITDDGELFSSRTLRLKKYTVRRTIKISSSR